MVEDDGAASRAVGRGGLSMQPASTMATCGPAGVPRTTPCLYLTYRFSIRYCISPDCRILHGPRHFARPRSVRVAVACAVDGRGPNPQPTPRCGATSLPKEIHSAFRRTPAVGCP